MNLMHRESFPVSLTNCRRNVEINGIKSREERQKVTSQAEKRKKVKTTIR